MSSQEPQLPDDEDDRSARPLEGLFQEIIRRGASLGFSSFFLTEEAIRRAFSCPGSCTTSSSSASASTFRA